MRTVKLNWNSTQYEVTASDIRKALLRFDDEFRGERTDSGTDYVVLWRKKRYPPKRILELATGIPVSHFHGGRMANGVFEKLGFKSYEDGSFKDTERTRLERRCPSLAKLTGILLKSQWQRLGVYDDEGKVFHTDKVMLEDGNYPGVYILAFPKEKDADLTRKRVRTKDVCYVGMSSVGVRTRLGQFIGAVRNGLGHSAGTRVFQMDSADKAGRSFFVASVSIPCRFRKRERSVADLGKLGTVASLEWHVIGCIKAKWKKEPWLNEK
jgi:hypothetical protein